MKRTKVGAIDVGTTKVCTIMGDMDDNGQLRILGVGIAPSHGCQRQAEQCNFGKVVRADSRTPHACQTPSGGIHVMI